MRVAAVGDVHVGTDSQDIVAEGFAVLAEQADVLLLAGDLTRCGEPVEAKILADILAAAGRDSRRRAGPQRGPTGDPLRLPGL